MRFSFCFGTVHLLNAVFILTVISQVIIFNYSKFPQCIQGENGPLKILGFLVMDGCIFVKLS